MRCNWYCKRVAELEAAYVFRAPQASLRQSGCSWSVASTICFLARREPTYEGKPMSYWFDQLPATEVVRGGQLQIAYLGDASKTTSDSEAEREKVIKRAQTARKAVVALGTNCLDALVERLAGEFPIKTRAKYWGLRLRVLKPVRSGPSSRLPDERRAQALTALLDLNTRAQPIAPELMRLARHPDPTVRAVALRALQAVSFPHYQQIRDESEMP
jgi:hypothetical protein